MELYACYSQYRVLWFLVTSVPHRVKTSQVAILLVRDVTVLPPLSPYRANPHQGCGIPHHPCGINADQKEVVKYPNLVSLPCQGCGAGLQVQHDLCNHGWSTLRSLTPGLSRILLPTLSPIFIQPQNSLSLKRRHPHLMKVVKYVLCDHN